MTNIFYGIYKLTRQFRVAFLGVLALVIALAAFVASQIRLEENILNLVPQDKEIRYINEVLQSFDINDQLVIHVYSEGKKSDPEGLIQFAHNFTDSLLIQNAIYIDSIRMEFSDKNIEALYQYYYDHLPLYLHSEDLEELKDKITDEGIANSIQQNLKSLMSPMSVVSKKMVVKDPLGLVGKPLQRARNLQGDDNIGLYQNHLVSKDGKHLIFFLDLANPPNETKNNGQFIENMNDFISSFATDSFKVEYFGQAAVAVGNANRIKNDIILTVNLAVALLFVFIALFYRKVYTFLLVLLPGLFGGIIGIAALSILRPGVSVISLGVGSVLLGITFDFALHFITHYRHQRDIKKLFADISTPILLSSITTSCAFFSLLLIRSNALQDLGLFAGVSVISAALFTLVVLPHIVINRKEESEKPQNAVQKVMARLAAFPFHKSKIAIALFIVISVVSLFTWKKFSFETDMLKLNYMDEQLAEYEQNLNDVSNFTVNNVFLITQGKDLWSALNNTKDLRALLQTEEVDTLLRDYALLSDLIPSSEIQRERLNSWNEFWRFNGGEGVFYKYDSIAQQAGFRSGTFGGLQQMISNDYKILSDEEANRLLSLFGQDLIIENEEGVGVISTVKLLGSNKEQFIELAKDIPNTTIIDKGYFTYRLVNLLRSDFGRLVNASLLVVFFIILLSYGRIELAIIAFTPIILSWLWTLGIMGLFGLKFNIINIIICTFIFGLGIDYSIFVVRGLTQKYKLGSDDIHSFKQSIILSAITTLVGIGVLIFAQHPALKSIALLAIVGIVSVIFITFTIPPILYNFLIQNRKDKGVVPFTLLSLFLTVFAFLWFVMGCAILLPIIPILRLPIGKEATRKLIFHRLLQWFTWSLVYIMVNIKKTMVDKHNIDFSKPSVIIANHHSFIDILYLLSLHHKVVMVTNEWVYNSPFFGKTVQFADFILSTDGVETQLDNINVLIENGYSIIIYPEGTRSPDFKLGRFKKGAFFLAEQFKLDIQPVIIHGTTYVMPKKDAFSLKTGNMSLKFLPRIKHDDHSFGETYSERTKKIGRYFKEEYQQYREQLEYPYYYKHVLIGNYLYKGPILEWYLRVKYRLEDKYRMFHDLVPKAGSVVDVGCGYGLMSYALAFSGENRNITAIDYDENKIEVAKNCPHIPENLHFDVGDVVTYNYQPSDAFVVSDVLHYLTPEKQGLLLENLYNSLNEGGSIIVRDGDKEKADRHKGTKLTELFSTKSGFNKTTNELSFISSESIKSFAESHKLDLEIIDITKLTSNIVFVLKKPA